MKNIPGQTIFHNYSNLLDDENIQRLRWKLLAKEVIADSTQKKILVKIFLIKYKIKNILFILYRQRLGMRLTRAGEYGVRCVLYLSGKERGVVVPRREIARAMEIPEQFLGKIAQQLARAGILEIIQGSKGGFRLLMSPDQVSLLDVVEAVVGELLLNDCLLRPDACSRTHSCTVHRVWQKARTQLRQILDEATFAELVGDETCMDPETTEKGFIKVDC